MTASIDTGNSTNICANTGTQPDLVCIERHGAVAVLRLNRPDKRNALDLAMRCAIAQATDLNLLVDKGAQDVADLASGHARGHSGSALSTQPVAGPRAALGLSLRTPEPAR